VAVAEKEKDKAEQFKADWLDAKKRASDLGNERDALRRELKSAQDAVAAAEVKVAEAEAVSAHNAELQKQLGEAQAENKTLAGQLSRAKAKIAAAEKVAEGLAELG
jgi:predicted RNase H-like nuclease (RuvC/YqgF family)